MEKEDPVVMALRPLGVKAEGDREIGIGLEEHGEVGKGHPPKEIVLGFGLIGPLDCLSEILDSSRILPEAQCH